jgi:hypothetical protein
MSARNCCPRFGLLACVIDHRETMSHSSKQLQTCLNAFSGTTIMCTMRIANLARQEIVFCGCSENLRIKISAGLFSHCGTCKREKTTGSQMVKAGKDRQTLG